MNITNKMRGAIATCLLYFIISFIMENGDQMSWILITTGITIFIMGIFEQLFDWKDEKYSQDIKGEKTIEKRMKDIAKSQSEVKE